ncbi:hypothetical protein AMECASPLE_031203 [Ameca splendens]|uniref:Uncharacterized protein n=1 Tax=Ameca splendens TaxID=208324 RepID=A0ABV0ZR28_9TELE
MFLERLVVLLFPTITPDGSLTKALNELQSLSIELKSHSGIDEQFTKMFETWFGKWGNLLVSIFTSLTVVVIADCVSCCATCIRALILRCNDRAIGSCDTRGLRLPEYQMDVVPEHTLMLSTEYLSTSDDVDLMEPNQSAGEIMILWCEEGNRTKRLQ